MSRSALNAPPTPSVDRADSAALLSDCGRYRYALWRQLAGGVGSLLVIGLNPSRADATCNDPTIRRLIGFAREIGAAELRVANLYAWRSADPRALRCVPDPIGPDNDAWIARLAADADTVAVAWGRQARAAGRITQVLDLLPPPMCLGINADGSPAHPLYLPRGSRLRPWPGPSQA